MEAKEILIKHLQKRNCIGNIYSDDEVYFACLDAINEALSQHDVIITDNCLKCKNNLPEKSYWCATNCIKGSKFHKSDDNDKLCHRTKFTDEYFKDFSNKMSKLYNSVIPKHLREE